MIVIADSGTSKTDWLFLDETDCHIQTPGINPFFQDADKIYANQKNRFNGLQKEKTSKLFFYGAGCIKGKTDSLVVEALQKIFYNADIFVEDDMLGAARAVLGNNEGIACILGTGANSCHYNGHKIADKIPTLGFILGDEGSGAHIGKLFLNDYFKKAIPQDLKALAEKEYNLEISEVLAAVYRSEYPSRYLAKFSRFLHKYNKHSYTQSLIKRSFSDFFAKNIEGYKNYKNLEVNFVGSVAYHFSVLLKEVASERGIMIRKILEKPIEGLKEYHSN